MSFFLEQYEIIKELGKGGMGEVYLAKDKKLGRKVAIKLLKISSFVESNQKEEIIARFKKEARAIAQLSHNNIVGMHELCEENGNHFMVMEYLEGKSLGKALEDDGLLPIDKCVDISIKMCNALSYIHNQSIVHRDIKPDNIILVNDETPKLTDFGIAQTETDELRLTQDGAILGSVMYISPEQLRNSKTVDNRTDIYSYGVSFYQMLTGKLPYDGETVGEVVSKILGQNPVLPRAHNKNIPYELEAIIMKSINKDKDKRYKTAEDMEKDLTNLQERMSFKKTSVNINNTHVNQGKNTSINNPSLKNTTISNYTQARVIEKASTQDIVISSVIRLAVILAFSFLTFNLFSDFFVSGATTELAEKLDYNIIQGPASKYLLYSFIFTKTLLLFAVVNSILLLVIGYIIPLDSKGINRNYNIKSELASTSIVAIISLIFIFSFFHDKDTLSEYNKAFTESTKTELKSEDEIIQKKGKLSFSPLIDYKLKNTIKTSTKVGFDDPSIQLREMVIENGDYTNLNIVKPPIVNDPMLTAIEDLFAGVFVFENPSKDAYTTRLEGILKQVSEGVLTTIPAEAKLTVAKNNNKVNAVFIEWEGNNITLKQGSIIILSKGQNFIYPKATDNNISIEIENPSDQNAFMFLYQNKIFSRALSIKAKSNQSLKLQPNEYEVIVLFGNQNVIPQVGKVAFSNKDIIKLDTIYSETNNYYKIQESHFSDKKQDSITNLKKEMKEQGNFFTKDADINKFKLVDFSKLRSL